MSLKTHLLAVDGLRILHNFVEDVQDYLGRHFALQWIAFCLQILINLH